MSRSKHKQRGNLSKKTSKNVNVTVTGEQNSNKTKDEGSERSEVDEENQNELVVDGKEDAFQGENEVKSKATSFLLMKFYTSKQVIRIYL
ncbi:hypothetical protein BVRB_5g115230 [Beta vulgaris subsp. vulgaris]|nr:hypothetical protein BVRB_5g115230 [Beta vulgaris subsp. vulgaris]